MVISKVLTGDTPLTVSLANFPWQGAAQVWRLRSTGGIQRLADLAVRRRAAGHHRAAAEHHALRACRRRT